MPYTTREIIWIVGAILSVCGTGIPLIIKLIKKTKQFIKERDWNKVMGVLPQLILEAEKFINYRGQEKKEFVKSRLAVFSVKNSIAFDEARFETAIDEIVRLTREVNKREKDSFCKEDSHAHHQQPSPYNQYNSY